MPSSTGINGRWWLHLNGSPTGPYDRTTIRAAISNGKIGDETPACLVGGREWRTLRELSEFAGLFNQKLQPPHLAGHPAPLITTPLSNTPVGKIMAKGPPMAAARSIAPVRSLEESAAKASPIESVKPSSMQDGKLVKEETAADRVANTLLFLLFAILVWLGKLDGHAWMNRLLLHRVRHFAPSTCRRTVRVAAHESPRTTKLQDRIRDTLTVDEIERIVI
jgi:hypothetical protein